MNTHSPDWACLDACLACANACDSCAASCLGEEHVQPLARCIMLNVDCAAICRQSASAMLRKSPGVPILCQASAQVCDMCAQECGAHPMAHCQECAQACMRCAKECRSMAAI